MLTLNAGQQKALRAILAARRVGGRHVLTGYAGTGKTTLMQAVADALRADGAKPVMTAPTHKAVAVLRTKVSNTKCETIHALLGLKPAQDGEVQTLKRSSRPLSGQYDVVIVDECSMIGADLLGFIDNDLEQHFVLFVGDPAQLPPVGETESSTFGFPGSVLDTVVRQAEGNPILLAAAAIRGCQTGQADWSWTLPSEAPPYGVYRAGDAADEWMRDAFTSPEFASNPDKFRYLCYTNKRAMEVNRKIRSWIYGWTETPFVVGERVLIRAPIMAQEQVAFSTNEETTVLEIAPARRTFRFDERPANGTQQAVPAWSTDLPVWRVRLEHDSRDAVCDIAQSVQAHEAIGRRLVTEARMNHGRWWDRYQFKEQIADLRSVYAMTVHTSQGSTFENVFVDVADIRKLEFSKPKEMWQMLYVALTRASHAVMLEGA